MLTAEQNELLTRVGPGTGMGNLMRRYWVPVLLDWELPRPDCPPVRVRILGEDLVAFRDTGGRVGLVQAPCPHRRASLFWGRNEDYGIRCVYHGWKFDIEGRCTDMPSEPETSNFKDKLRIKAYPTVELGGVVWAYMGPPDKRPPLPKLGWTQVPDTHRGVTKVIEECNWLQCLEGGIDTVHTNFLHRTFAGSGVEAMDKARAFSLAAHVEVVPTDYGYTYAGIRRMGDEGDYVRGYHFVMPWHQIRPLQFNAKNKPRNNGHMWVPIDDHHTMVWNWTYTYGAEPLDEEERSHRGSGNEFGADIDPKTFRSIRNASNDYMIDREVQATKTYSGIEGVNTQDRAVQESMGFICDRTEERLGTTDRAIIMARKMLLQAVRTVADGGDPPGLGENIYRLRGIERVLPTSKGWLEALSPYLYDMAS